MILGTPLISAAISIQTDSIHISLLLEIRSTFGTLSRCIVHSNYSILKNEYKSLCRSTAAGFSGTWFCRVMCKLLECFFLCKRWGETHQLRRGEYLHRVLEIKAAEDFEISDNVKSCETMKCGGILCEMENFAADAASADSGSRHQACQFTKKWGRLHYSFEERPRDG